MKLRTVMKIAVTTSIVLFCTALVVYLFFKLSAIENREEFNLYKLVPTDATAVLEIDDVGSLIEDIDELDCSKDHHFLYISKLFSLLKTHIYALQSESPHGLSRQMNKMLISFHEPDNDKNQVLYCGLGVGDYSLVEKLIQKYFSSVFSTKLSSYKGEEIRIYPMPDGNFLACYLTSRFVAVSFQKRLIEQVIDASLSKRSLFKDPSFRSVHKEKRLNGPATVYARMQSLDMGKMTDGVHSKASLGGWTEFDVKMGGRTIYFTGISHDTDTCLTFMNMLRKQQPIEGFLSEPLPITTFFFSHRSISDWQAVFDFTSDQQRVTTAHPSYIEERDAELIRYLKENGGIEVTTCLFEHKDSVSAPAIVMSLSTNDVSKAELVLKHLIETSPEDPDDILWKGGRKSAVWLQNQLIYRMPRNTLFAQLAGVSVTESHTYACFYAGRLLLAPDPADLLLYMDCVEKGEVLNYTVAYNDGISGLSNMYHFMLFSDLEKVFAQPENYVRLIPSFFFRNADFFRHFKLAAQFTCTDGVVSPNVVLLYKQQ